MAGSRRRRRRADLPDGVDVPADLEDDEFGPTIGAQAREMDGASEPDGEELGVTRRGDWRRFVHTGAIPVEDGIRARTRRGRIGSSWWSQSILSVIESLELGGRLDRARTYARKGQVIDLEVSPGHITALVQGSRATPYRVSVELRTLSPEAWAAAVDAMAKKASFSARLLAGEMPEDIGDAFDTGRVRLFPASDDELSMRCTCPDHAVPCKHVAAVLYLLAEQLDEDPFLLMLWRGMTKEDLLSRLRARRGRGATAGAEAAPRAVDSASLEDRLDDFWGRSDVRLVDHVPVPARDPVEFAESTDPKARPLRRLLRTPAYRRILGDAAKASAKLALSERGHALTRD